MGTSDSPPSRVVNLVEQFESNYESYQKAEYKEGQVRVEFLNPLFEALGWDVQNKEGRPEPFKEVVHEGRVKIGGKPHAPDYSFRVGGERKFFVEAKKPSVNIKGDTNPAFQLRRYAWSAQLPLSILTDFEEFAVYDTRVEPDKEDTARKARLAYIKSDELVEEWGRIQSLFSKQAVQNGSLDEYTEEEKRGEDKVDESFLKEIEDWRKSLAKELSSQNRDLGERELNISVQRIIDRIVFLRICEDRGIEPYGKLKDITRDEDPYSTLVSEFLDAEKRYNSGLFYFRKEEGEGENIDEVTIGLDVSPDTVVGVVKNLYYPESPFEFSVIPADILGKVYEKFLSRVISDSEGEISVEEKPEVKKSGGVYYTPKYVVDYIVERSLAPLVDGKSWKEVQEISVLDPACGSGSFLIGAYQYLLDWHLQYYVNNDPGKHSRGRPPRIQEGVTGDWKLTLTEKKRILKDNIYGVDVDQKATEVCKLSLLLKMLEDESGESIDNQIEIFKTKILPDLSNNIKCGNSLIETDYFEGKSMSAFSDDELYSINAFDWDVEFSEIMENGGFDAVIGNPPYDVLEKERGKASWPHDALHEYVDRKKKYAPANVFKLNLFRFFAVRFLQLARSEGRIGAIMPLSLLGDISCRSARKHLIETTKDLEVDCFPQKDDPSKRIFEEAKLSTAVYTGSADSTGEDDSMTVRVYPEDSFEDEYTEAEVNLTDLEVLDPKNAPVPLGSGEAWSVCRKVHRLSTVSRMDDVEDLNVRRGEINQTTYKKYIRSEKQGDELELLKGAEVGQYLHRDTMSQGKEEWFAEDKFRADGNQRPISRNRRIATQRITGVDEKLRLVATIIDPPYYFSDSTNSISLSEESDYSLEYVLALVNSRLYQMRFRITSTNNNVGTNEIESLPFREIDFDDEEESEKHDELEELVSDLMDLRVKEVNSSGQRATIVSRQKKSRRKEIEQKVYDLYDLTDQEIRTVKDKWKGVRPRST
ncbi:MAG: Eco57I restriction-modification methylase domain-containing protein [Candidatus Aenigmatarchaeota archaeon]